uniref:Uncharacterized protein n=1 Tax=Neogobius melanostomus TaxID=47308 RepID=A0A8C6TB05_9GOBI
MWICSLTGFTLGWTYHYSNETMKWAEARKWCQTNFSDMVVIQNQLENDYLVDLLPPRNSSPYFWIGISKTYANETWRWIGNNSTWMGNESWAENEPNNNSTEFCVEIYTRPGPSRGKWNDAKCGADKYATCYKAQCTDSTCDRGRCHEIINNVTCLCEPGFVGNRCQTVNEWWWSEGREACFTYKCKCFSLCHLSWCACIDVLPVAAVECAPVPDLDHGNLKCSSMNLTVNSTCRVTCSFGFFTIASEHVTCHTSGLWSGPRPNCAKRWAIKISKNSIL